MIQNAAARITKLRSDEVDELLLNADGQFGQISTIGAILLIEAFVAH